MPSAQAPEAFGAGLRRFAEGPYGRLLAKAAGISALMLGLAGVGALAMAQGLKPRQTVDQSDPHARAAAPAHVAAGLALPTVTPGAPEPAAPAAPAGEAPIPSASAPQAPAPSASAPDLPAPSGMTPDGRVILNLATVSDLRHLPGIGQKRAEAILQVRQKLGKFKRVTDLLRVKGIGPKRLKQLAPKMVLDPEPAPAPGARP